MLILQVDTRKFNIPFSLEGMPFIHNFVGRKEEMQQLERCLLPNTTNQARRKVFVLQGLGGIGKTQLAIEYVREHHSSYSAVLWLDGSSRDLLRQSLAQITRRLPSEQVTTKTTTMSQGDNVDDLAAATLRWLSLPANKCWLIIIDNVDREYQRNGADDQAYNLKDAFPAADHGSVLVTSRLASVARHGDTVRLGRVSEEEARMILEQSAGGVVLGESMVWSSLMIVMQSTS